MRTNARLLIAFSLCCLLTISAAAHSGGTDSKGGHIDHSTGEYHYHHGMSAHQHPGGVCPYNQTPKPKTGTSNKNSTKNTLTIKPASNQSTPKSKAESREDWDLDKDQIISIGFSVVIAAAALYLWFTK